MLANFSVSTKEASLTDKRKDKNKYKKGNKGGAAQKRQKITETTEQITGAPIYDNPVN